MKRKYWIGLVAVTLSMCLVILGTLSSEEIKKVRIKDATDINSTESQAAQAAITKFRSYNEYPVYVHTEAVENGVLVLYRRFMKENHYDLNVEHVRWTWRGWKWAWGGSMSGGQGAQSDGLFVEYLPYNGRQDSPFPILLGAVTNQNIHKLHISDGAQYEAEPQLIRAHHPRDEQHSWLARVPRHAGKVLTVTALDQSGKVVSVKKLSRNELEPAEEQ
ncbi:hypothetical protein SY83_21340 [Paenibacillus swuensis]|uniref:Uncharacterized protein n=1 Tax=Paenibacillus swuensis TaxID=1178515 RepID=A0A172TMZ4_9BACL|nr:hypothetical protein [Paenibacillus swuensis]ANE48400.1 hypothetical protein SY83_21340 [Paenibacillus swuensis]